MKGTKSKSRSDLEKAFGKFGSEVEINHTREMTYFTVFVDKDQVE